MVLYMFDAILSSHPTLTFYHRVQKSVLYICVSFAVSQGHHFHLSKFHIYALTYCIGVFLSDLGRAFNTEQAAHGSIAFCKTEMELLLFLLYHALF